jgi:hypothetical protein
LRRDPDGSVLWTTPSGRRSRTVRPVLAPVEITGKPPSAPPVTPLGPDDDLRDVLEQRLRRPVTTAPARGADDAPY